MFIKGKKIRFGYKEHRHLLRTMDGNIYAFEINCCKKKSKTFFGFGGDAVVQLLQVVEKNFHEVYFDNVFASFDLMVQLTIDGYFVCGTLRENVSGSYLLQHKKVVAKKKRGWDKSKISKASMYGSVERQQSCRVCIKLLGRGADEKYVALRPNSKNSSL